MRDQAIEAMANSLVAHGLDLLVSLDSSDRLAGYALDALLDYLTEHADEWGEATVGQAMPDWRAEDWIGYGRGHDDRVAQRLLAVLR